MQTEAVEVVFVLPIGLKATVRVPPTEATPLTPSMEELPETRSLS